MRAVVAVVYKGARQLRVREVPEPAPGPVLGHEFSARVVAVGRDAGGLAPGDLVGVNPNENGGECSFCRDGDEQLCSIRAHILPTAAGLAPGQYAAAVPHLPC